MDDKKEWIINAAMEVFSQFGYKKASLAEIAKRVGIAKSTIYLYFKNKQDLFRTLVQRESKRIFDFMKPNVEKVENSIDKLRVWAHLRFDVAKDMSRLIKFDAKEIFHDILPRIEKIPNNFIELEINFLKEILQYGIKRKEIRNDIDVELLVYGLVYAMKGVTEKWVVDGLSISIKGKLDVLLSVLFNGIKREKK